MEGALLRAVAKERAARANRKLCIFNSGKIEEENQLFLNFSDRNH